MKGDSVITIVVTNEETLKQIENNKLRVIGFNTFSNSPDKSQISSKTLELQDINSDSRLEHCDKEYICNSHTSSDSIITKSIGSEIFTISPTILKNIPRTPSTYELKEGIKNLKSPNKRSESSNSYNDSTSGSSFDEQTNTASLSPCNTVINRTNVDKKYSVKNLAEIPIQDEFEDELDFSKVIFGNSFRDYRYKHILKSFSDSFINSSNSNNGTRQSWNVKKPNTFPKFDNDNHNLNPEDNFIEVGIAGINEYMEL